MDFVKGEQIREKLRLEIYAKDNRIRQKEQQILDNIMSFEENFEKEFLQICAKKKFGKKSLQDFFMEQGGVNDFPQKVILKNNIEQANLKTTVLNIVKKCDANLFEQIEKHNDNMQIKLSYCGVLCYDFVCTYIVNYVVQKNGYEYRSKYDISKHSRVDGRTEFATFEQKNAVMNFSKNQVARNIKVLNLADAENCVIQIPKLKNTEMNKIYGCVKKQIIKNIEQDKKSKFAFKNHTLVGVDVEAFDCTYVLLPYYNIRVKKPGLDIKFEVNANSKMLVK